MSPIENFNIRFNAFNLAENSHPLKFNVSEKPTLDDLIERAAKIEKYLREGMDG